MTPSGFGAPTRQCDVVMKGGITSGIVYPPLVLELARSYRFRSIGGTSAGAIAAAVTAAAEFGRERAGFEKLQALNAWLADGTHLLDLFQATPATRPLLKLLLALERRSRTEPAPNPLARLVTRFWSAFPPAVRVLLDTIPGAMRDALPLPWWLATIAGALFGGWLDVVLARGFFYPAHPHLQVVAAIVFPIMFVGSYLGSLGACGWGLWRRLVVQVPAQGFGICTGLGAGADADAPALTNWLHGRIQDLAGLGAGAPPLTVGDLRGKRVPEGGEDAGIELRMVSTSLSLGRSVALPIEDETFLFAEDDMRQLFPQTVVEHLLAHAAPADAGHAVPAGYHALPAADDLPVIVLARMSLSFPVLLSAVPLYLPAADGAGVRRVWFSDGGLTSNFPIHFFDAWLPSRPTFGVNLTSAPRGQASARAGSVFLPAAGLPTGPEFTGIDSLAGFLGAIWTTSQNFRDNTLAALPGYRERVVQIPLADDEGGLNLAMGPAAVHRIIAKGDDAGDLLLAFDLKQHQWVRLLTFMAQFERRVLRMGTVFRTAGYDQLVATGVTPDFPFHRDAQWRREALARLELLERYAAAIAEREQLRAPLGDGRTFFELDAPQPEGSLRVTPRE